LASNLYDVLADFSGFQSYYTRSHTNKVFLFVMTSLIVLPKVNVLKALVTREDWSITGQSFLIANVFVHSKFLQFSLFVESLKLSLS
jgi:hypothetical protein